MFDIGGVWIRDGIVIYAAPKQPPRVFFLSVRYSKENTGASDGNPEVTLAKMGVYRNSITTSS